MSTKVRKQIYLEEKQNRRLKDRAKAESISETAIIRRALEHELSEVRPIPNPAAFESFLELARKRLAEGPLPGGRNWKRDDIYEERLARYGKKRSSD